MPMQLYSLPGVGGEGESGVEGGVPGEVLAPAVGEVHLSLHLGPGVSGRQGPGGGHQHDVQHSHQHPQSGNCKDFLIYAENYNWAGGEAAASEQLQCNAVPLSSLWGLKVTRIWNMNALIAHFLSTPLLMNTCRVATMRLSIMFSSGSVRGVSSRPVLCFHCCLYTLHTLHCCGLLTAASISPPPLCWHGTEVGGGDTRTDGNIGRSNFSESFPATFLSFDSFALLYRIQRRQKEDWKQIVFVYTELLKLSKTTLTFFWLVEICLQKI